MNKVRGGKNWMRGELAAKLRRAGISTADNYAGLLDSLESDLLPDEKIRIHMVNSINASSMTLLSFKDEAAVFLYLEAAAHAYAKSMGDRIHIETCYLN